jgi:hypothetical protein
VVPRHVVKPLRTRPENDKNDGNNKTNKTHNYKTLPRPSANTRDRATHTRRRAFVPSCARCKKDAPRDCGSMKLLDPIGRGNDVEWKKMQGARTFFPQMILYRYFDVNAVFFIL